MIAGLLTASKGGSISEVLVAMTIVPIGLLGAMTAFHTSERIIAQGTLASRAIAMVESRIEAKRATRWGRLLEDDLHHDGRSVLMHDDGQGGDAIAGDGVYSAKSERDGILLTWTVTPSRRGSLATSGYVILEARASYAAGEARHEIRIGTLRANPVFVGP